VALAAGLLAPVSRAQQVTGAQIDGHITDPRGQAIAGAQVKASSVDTGLPHSTVTDGTGRYVFPNLPVGHYQFEVSSPGFKTYVQKGIELQMASNRNTSVTLQVGSVTESIQVTADAAQVKTKENSIAQVVEARRLVDLPLNGRNLTQLLVLGRKVEGEVLGIAAVVCLLDIAIVLAQLGID
jgi:hypothetical protein